LYAILILPAVTFKALFEDASAAFPADCRDRVQEMTHFQSRKATSALPTSKMANDKAA